MKITPFSYPATIIMVRSLASTLSKEDGYSTDVDILADQSTGHYSLVTSNTDPNPVYYGESDGNDRCLYWSSTDATWYISKYKQRRNDNNPCDTDRIFAKCQQPVLSQCNEDESSTISVSSIQYCVTIQTSTNLYQINGKDIYNHHMFISSDNDRVIWYDITDGLWKVSDEINADQSYANCSKSNIFDCSYTADPFTSSFDIDTCDAISIVSSIPSIEPTSSPVILSRLSMLSSKYDNAPTPFPSIPSEEAASDIPSTTELPTFRPTMNDLSLKIDIDVTKESGQIPEGSVDADEYVAFEETKVITSGSEIKSNSIDIATFTPHRAMFFILIIVVVSILCGISSAILAIGCCMWCKRKPAPKIYRKVSPKYDEKIKENMDDQIEFQIQPSESQDLNISVNLKDYTQWNMQEVASWLFGLENGRYKPYINQLITGFKNDGVTTSDLPELDVADLRSFGMMTFHDRWDLKQHLKSLKDGPLSPGSPELDERISDQYAVVESVDEDLDDDDKSEQEEESKEREFSEGVRKYSFKHFRMSLDMDQILENDEEVLGDDQLTEGMSVYAE